MGKRALFVWSSACFCAGCAAGSVLSRPGFIFVFALAASAFMAVFFKKTKRLIAILPLILALGCFYPSLYGSFAGADKTLSEPVVLSPLFYAKEELSGEIRRNLSPSSSALALGILFGDKSGFSPEFRKNLSDTGTTHIVALSGFNITIVVSFIGTLFFFLPIRLRPLAVALGIAAFVGLVGPSASVVRAAIMGALILLARNSGRLVDIKGPISFAALVMVLLNPLVIADDAGFVLSFSALLGIVYIAPQLKRFLFKEENVGFFKSLFTECFSAEIAAAPAIMVMFGSFSWLSFVPNLMIIWTVPAAMAFSFASGVVSFLSYRLAFPFSAAAEAVLSYETGIIDFFARCF